MWVGRNENMLGKEYQEYTQTTCSQHYSIRRSCRGITVVTFCLETAFPLPDSLMTRHSWAQGMGPWAGLCYRAHTKPGVWEMDLPVSKIFFQPKESGDKKKNGYLFQCIMCPDFYLSSNLLLYVSVISTLSWYSEGNQSLNHLFPFYCWKNWETRSGYGSSGILDLVGSDWLELLSSSVP